MPSEGWSAVPNQAAERIIQDRWSSESPPRVKLRPPIAWDELAGIHRSRCFHLHCWDPLAPLLAAFSEENNPDYLGVASEVALDWANQYPSVVTQSEFAWYDMAVGIRAYRLAFLLDVAARSEDFPASDLGTLLTCAALHAEVLADEARFRADNNHGFYFAAGQLALATRFPTLDFSAPGRDQAIARLRRMLATQFSEEGVHREHSPDYHRMVYDTFCALLDAGLLDGSEFTEDRQRIEEALAWFVLPNGRLAMLGDTPHRLMVQKRARRQFHHPALQFVSSGGKSGRAPGEAMKAFPASGYVVIRSGWPSGSRDFDQCSYLAHNCAFHSRIHKHADDLSFVWYDRGQELLIDPGRYGYLGRTEVGSPLWQDGFWYSDPNRVYVESTRAHNTIEVDGRNFVRHRAKPYGSALRRWGERAGVWYIEAEVRHWTSIRHVRMLLFRPAEWLVVFDWLHDNVQQEHDFRQRFHFAPELDVVDRGDFSEVTLNGTDERLYVVPLLPTHPIEPVRGQHHPDLLGWISRQDGEMTPCWTSGYLCSRVTYCTFATLFTFGRDPPQPLPKANKVARSGRTTRLRWHHEGVRHTLECDRPADGPIRVDYRLTLPSLNAD